MYEITIEKDINSKTRGPQEFGTNYLIKEDIQQQRLLNIF
jgi:hypothetical protein